VILGTKTSDSKTEDYMRAKSPTFSSFDSEGSKLNGWSIINFGPCKDVVSTALQLEIQIKHGKLARFNDVKLKIPKKNNECHLLVVRDPAIKAPRYFKVKWLSQEMLNEYFFGCQDQTIDSTAFIKPDVLKIPPPHIAAIFKEEEISKDFIYRANPFFRQYMELDFIVTPPSETKYSAKIKAVEVSFFHPEISNIEKQYIVSQFGSPMYKQNATIYWPNDFTIIQGAKVVFKYLYWYQDGYEIIETGMVTNTIEL
jgi:hypothetical protein